MQNFAFHTPNSVADALAALRAAGDGRLLAGGQSLIPMMKLGRAAPSDLVSLGAVAALRGVRREGDALVVGAMTTHTAVVDSPEVREHLPGLAALVEVIGDPQVRNRGTIGGAAVHNDPAADYPAGVLGLGASVITDRREIPADHFFRGAFTTALEEDEIVTALRFPLPAKAGYCKFANPASGFALVGVMVSDGSAGARVAVTGAGSSVFRWEEAEAALSNDFSAAALEGLTPPVARMVTDAAASADYRAHLAGVMARRAVAACA
ncbi:xanthine dehydrogenase family protein subunit M [soil metagenome]